MTLHTIFPQYKPSKIAAPYADCYAFTDPKIGLIIEPLVHSATHALICAMSAAKMCTSSAPLKKIRLDFTDDLYLYRAFSDDDLVIKLVYKNPDDKFYVYEVEVLSPERAATRFAIADEFKGKMEVDLCQHLTDYFPTPPPLIWVRVTFDTNPILKELEPAMRPAAQEKS